MVKALPKPAKGAAALADLSPDELARAVQTAAERHVGPARAARLRVYIASVLGEDEQVGRLTGPAFDVIEHLDAQRQQQLLIRSTAHRAVLDEPLFESSAVAEALGRSGANGREAASRLRLSGRLVGIRQGNRYLYPAFQFDLAHRQVPAVVAEVNQRLDAAGDPWGVASWWISENPRLSGRAPRDLIGTSDDSDLLALAEAESTE
jgi:hypothetical protein